MKILRMNNEKGKKIFEDNGTEHAAVYRGVMELMSRFGYVSLRELEYGFGLTLQAAIDRLRYLEKADLIEKFPSLTRPEHFFCLTPHGRKMAQLHTLSDEIHGFRPSNYSVVNQNHQRKLVQLFLALKKVLAKDFHGWLSETRLRQEAGLKSVPSIRKRVFDGEFLMNVQKTKYLVRENGSLDKNSVTQDLWRCALELELTLKSPDRYENQFDGLIPVLYDADKRQQKFPLIVFLGDTPTILDRLKQQYLKRHQLYGACYFVFGLVERFLTELGEAPLEKFLGSNSVIIKASELNQTQVKVKAS